MHKTVTGGMLDDILTRPEDLLVLIGADGDEDDNGDSGEPNDEDELDDEKRQDDDNPGEPDDKSKKDDQKNDEKSRTLTEDEFRRWTNFEEERTRVQNARRKAIQERDEAREELSKLKAKGATDDQAKEQLTTLGEENTKLKETNRKLALDNAFLKDNNYEWVDPEAALALADLSDVEFNDDGTVSGLKVALDALASKKPWLIRKEDKKPAAKRSGDPTGSGSQKPDVKRQKRDEELRKMYPALRR